jgi:hypothetical protein
MFRLSQPNNGCVYCARIDGIRAEDDQHFNIIIDDDGTFVGILLLFIVVIPNASEFLVPPASRAY